MASQEIEQDRQSYPFVPLIGPNDIRVLELQPGRWDDSLALMLRKASLDSRSRYTALSYVWGPTTDGRNVSINGDYHMPITDNLHKALRRIRHNRDVITMWVDAICINQDDLRKKSRQVAMIGDIYRAATDTIVWLGESERTSSIHLRPAFAHLMSLEYYIYLWISDSYWMVRRLFKGKLVGEPAAVNRSESNGIPHWYARAWTVQEFIFSRTVYLYWGKAKIKYSRSTLPYDMIMTADPGTLGKVRHRCGVDVFDTKHRLNILEAIRGRDFGDQRLIDAYNALFTYSGLPQATNPRDRVYSVLGLIDSEEARLIGVDYRLTCEQISAKATYAAIKRYGDLEILFYVQLRRPDTNHVPSWAVDFIATRIPSWQLRVDFSTRADMARFRLDDSFSCLTVRAFLLDVATYTRSIPVCAMQCSHDSIESQDDTNGVSLHTLIPAQTASSQETEDQNEVSIRPEDISQIPSDFSQAAIQHALEHNSAILSRSRLETNEQSVQIEQLYKRIHFVLDSIATKGASEGRAFMTAGGLIGWAPWTLRPGCVLVYVPGSEFLIGLQRHDKLFRFLGMACVPGVEVNTVGAGNVADEQEFTIV